MVILSIKKRQPEAPLYYRQRPYHRDVLNRKLRRRKNMRRVRLWHHRSR
ncbi:MAG: hypothetical protein GX324_05505 [Aeromonadales bacterium]|nr:hypothetical protein [Aeromonadales bacterium]